MKAMIWLAFSLLLIGTGVACIANPLHTMIMLAYLVGCVMILSGVGSLAYFIQSRFVMILLDGLLSCGFGLVLLFGGEEVAQNFVPLFIALWLILKGGLWLIHAWRLAHISMLTRGVKAMGWLYILLGALFVAFPQVLATLISFLLGMILIISGMVGLLLWNNLR